MKLKDVLIRVTDRRLMLPDDHPHNELIGFRFISTSLMIGVVILILAVFA